MTSRSSLLQVRELKRRIAIAVSKLKEWAAECADCDGTGITTNIDSGAAQDCQECLDIREAIEDLEMPL